MGRKFRDIGADASAVVPSLPRRAEVLGRRATVQYVNGVLRSGPPPWRIDQSSDAVALLPHPGRATSGGLPASEELGI